VRGHADAETLAAFREELLSRRKAARVSAHLAACSRCARLDAQLAEVPALLTRSTAPPMPDALAARIEAAIAAEAAARAAAAADGTVAAGAAGAGAGLRDSAARPSRPSGGPGRSTLALRAAAVTAAVVVVAGGGYEVARLLSGNPEPATSASRAGVPAPATKREAPQVSAGGFSRSGDRAAAGGSAPYPLVVSSGTDYQPAQLKSQVTAVLAQHGASATAGPTPGPLPNHSARSVHRTLPCIPHVAGGMRPLLVDQARYQGRPATVIVIPGPPGTARALVVAGRCTATTGRVLARATLPRSG